MKMRRFRLTTAATVLVVALLIVGCGLPIGSLPRPADNIILFVGDGMGSEQLAAASLYETGERDGLFIQSLPVRTSVATWSASSDITDSAAGATAMATGTKVQNGAVSVMLPGDGRDLPTILEMAKADGKAVGLVTTAFLTHATPAGFGAHVASREDYEGIARDYLNGSQPDVLFGGGGYGLAVDNTTAAGYSVATTADELAALVDSGQTQVAALVGDGHLPYIYDGRPDDCPSLADLTGAAIDILSQDPDGYFLMVEAGRIDHAAHANDIARMVPEVLELDQVVRQVAEDTDIMAGTLVIVTADHETGGLTVLESHGAGEFPSVSWSTDYHTGVNVPLYARGVSASWMDDVSDNTGIFEVMVRLFAF